MTTNPLPQHILFRHRTPCSSFAALHTSLGKETPLGSPRARQHAILLSAAMRNILYGVKSSPGAGRERLSKAHAVASDDSNSVLRLASGARLGLCVISALEDVVVDEGKVCNSEEKHAVRVVLAPTRTTCPLVSIETRCSCCRST